MLIHKTVATLVHLPSIRHVDEPRNLTTVDEALSICGRRVDANTVCSVRHNRGCVSPDGRSRPHIASGEQQALSWYIKQQRTDPVIHYRLHTRALSLYQRQFLQHTLKSNLPDRQQAHHRRRHSATKRFACLFVQHSSHPESCWETRQPASETGNQFVRLPGLQLGSESCSCSGNRAACVVSQPVRH